jgi:hypothetical protein
MARHRGDGCRGVRALTRSGDRHRIGGRSPIGFTVPPRALEQLECEPADQPTGSDDHDQHDDDFDEHDHDDDQHHGDDPAKRFDHDVDHRAFGDDNDNGVEFVRDNNDNECPVEGISEALPGGWRATSP